MPETRPIASLREHERAALVPEMRPDEYEALLADAHDHGIVTPLEITTRGIVLDGRHRLRAARELGLTQVPVRIVAPTDEIEHMVSMAINRRQLTASQRAAVAVELDEYRTEREQATLRQRANLNQHAEVATLPPRGERSRDLAARAAGTSPRTVQDAATVRAHDPALFEQVKTGRLPAHTAARRVRRAQRDQTLVSPPLPDGTFELVYADPPWQLGNPESAYAPENHYPTLPLDEIKQIDVPAADNAVLFLWAVSSRLPEALEVLNAWGFTYKTSLVWVKDSIGLGTWVRHRHEHLLIGRRGTHPAPEPEDRPDSVITAPRTRHSEKPGCVYELLEHAYPTASKLELFSRRARHGWTAWGNQVENGEAAA